MRVKLLLALTLLLAVQGRAQTKAGPTNNGDFRCNYAKVSRLLPGHFLKMRSGPSANSSVIARLRLGQPVYVCDESREWFQVFYGTADGICAQTWPDGLDSKRAKSCNAGWVNRRWIDVLSG